MDSNNTDYNSSVNREEGNSFNQMPKKKGNNAVLIAVVVFVLIIVGMFIFAFLKKSNNETPTPQKEEQVEDAYSNIDRIDAKHFYIDGVHTVAGEVAMPTPCDLLEARSIVAESYPEQITIDFTVVNEADFCTQVVTPQRFKVSSTASADATFQALFMGRKVELNLIEAEPGETPEDFELFIKG